MAKAFSIRDFMQDARQQDSGSDVYERVSVYDIGMNPRNEYTLSEIEKIKDSIYALGGVQQNVVLVRCPEGADHTYLALDGHRRLTASRELVSEGYAEFEYVPAVIKGQIDADTEEAMLVMMNSTQRNKTDWEKVMEHMRLKEIIPKLKKRQGLDGRTRDIEADMLGVSRGQINIYNTIGTRLNAELMEMFRNGSINISLAYEVAKQEPDIQNRVAGLVHANGNISEDDMRRLTMPEIDKENVPESGTFKEQQHEPVSA
ncbi:MAG: ParB/RepB/Spo0J family partition protein, partial [Lachnospiraceae bacterium]|nr:ParB/RepB/Spo0J family partition protein [Lachnospiraceae bacterium]